MLKKLSLAALAAVSMCAAAQNSDNGSMNFNQANQFCKKQMSDELRAGDNYVLSNLIDYGPTDVANCVVLGLGRANWEATTISANTYAYNVPGSSSYTTSTTNSDGTVTTTTTTTSADLGTWEANARPMRMLMMGSEPRWVDYQKAGDIVASNLDNTSQKTIFWAWWNGTADISATEAQKDAIVRAVRNDGRFGDRRNYGPLPASLDWANQ